MDVVGCAVERVDDPPVVGLCILDSQIFFAKETVIRILVVNNAEDGILRVHIRLGHQVLAALLTDREFL